MKRSQPEQSLETLQEIRSIMERSARFISLSGWSGVWAGCTALASAVIAYQWLEAWGGSGDMTGTIYTVNIQETEVYKFILLALGTLLTAAAGGLFFTWRKVQVQRASLWNKASRQFLFHLMLPLIAGGFFITGFLYYGHALYIAPACLVFYGMALINGSKYTLSDIRHLGIIEVVLGCICIYFPGYGLYFWAFGFGVLHIFYGVIMWSKYDKQAG